MHVPGGDRGDVPAGAETSGAGGGGATLFLSYARLDGRDDAVARFAGDLAAAVGALRPLGVASWSLFRDVGSIELGEAWEASIAGALRGARLFLALLSPTYFARPHCGKEWAAFQSRLDGRHPQPLIVPLLWEPFPPDIVPAAVARLQSNHEALGQLYSREGLRHLLRDPALEPEYRRLVGVLAARLASLLEAYPLPEGRDLPPLDRFRSAFEPSRWAAAGVRAAVAVGLLAALTAGGVVAWTRAHESPPVPAALPAPGVATAPTMKRGAPVRVPLHVSPDRVAVWVDDGAAPACITPCADGVTLGHGERHRLALRREGFEAQLFDVEVTEALVAGGVVRRLLPEKLVKGAP